MFCYWAIHDSVIIYIASMLWTWSQEYYSYSNVCFLPWPSHWLKSLLQKFYGRHHNLVGRYEIFISQITMDLLFFYVVVFFPLSLQRLLPEFTIYMSSTVVPYKKQELLTLHEPRLFLRSLCCSFFVVFCVSRLCIFMFWVPCCDVRYDFSIKTMFGSSLPSVVCSSAHVLFTLFVFAYV